MDLTNINFDPKDIGKKILDMLKQQGEDFVKNNKQTAVELTEDEIKAILDQTFCEHLPEIFVLTPEATLEQQAALEKVLTARTQILQLVATATQKNAARVAQLRANAISTVKSVITAIGSIILQNVVKTALAGAIG